MLTRHHCLLALLKGELEYFGDKWFYRISKRQNLHFELDLVAWMSWFGLGIGSDVSIPAFSLEGYERTELYNSPFGEGDFLLS